MNPRLQPGLHFRIREHEVLRKAKLSPHTANGIITHVSDSHISFIVSNSITQKQLFAKCRYAEFQIYFSIIPWHPLDTDSISIHAAAKNFPEDFL